MPSDLDALQIAMQTLNPNMPLTYDQREENYRLRQERLDKQAALDRAEQAKIYASYGTNTPGHSTGVNVPR